MLQRLWQLKWTLLLGFAFLGAVLWSATFGDMLSRVLGLFLVICFILSIVLSVALAFASKSKIAVTRIVLNLAFGLLFFPTIQLGAHFRDRIFLTHLVRFQELTGKLIKDKCTPNKSEPSSGFVSLPVGYSDLDIKDHALVDCGTNNITVRYLMQDSNALGHSGFMYRSDDSESALARDFPKLVCTRLAPHWFYFLQ